MVTTVVMRGESSESALCVDGLARRLLRQWQDGRSESKPAHEGRVTLGCRMALGPLAPHFHHLAPSSARLQGKV
jgi:hypothetical protein